MKRLFVAIKVVPEQTLLKALESIQQKLSADSINWVKPDNLHITLKFLGDTPEKKIPSIIGALHKSTDTLYPSEFFVEGFGYFGNLRFPRVLWMGIMERDQNNLEKVYAGVQKNLEPLGFPAEEHFFKPHLTIGRIKNISDTRILRELEGIFSTLPFQKVPVDSFSLYESKLTPSGPVYSLVEKFTFSKK
ncbi:MAG: RNA 2',3'-cyclic phosphodiesterase [Bacteroidota bacterium]